jgi:hypothetical protein
MSDSDGQSVEMDEMEPQLPPQLEELLRDVEKDRKALLKTAAYGKSPEQMRQFIAQFVLPRMAVMIEIFGTALFDTYQLASSNTRQQQKLHRWTAKHLRALGAEVNDNDVLPGVGDELIQRFSEAFYAIGTMLATKLPDDKEMESTYNRCAAAFDELLKELMGEQAFDEDEDDEDEDDEGDGEGDGEGGDDAGGDAAEQPEPPAEKE